MTVNDLELELDKKLDEASGNTTSSSEIEITEDKKQDTAQEGGAANTQDTGDADIIATLKKQLADANSSRDQAKERAAMLEKQHKESSAKVLTAEQEAINAREQSIDNAITAGKSELSNVRQQLKEAAASNNFEATADLTEKLADVKFQLNSLEAQKKGIAEYKENYAKRQERQQETSNEPTYTPRTKAWIDSHPRFNTDAEYKAICFEADTGARVRNIAPDSDEYFRFVEGRLKAAGLEKDDEGKPAEDRVMTIESKKENKPSAASTAAAPSRTAGGSSGYARKGGKLHVSSETVEYAVITGYAKDEKDVQGIRAYVESLEKLKADGRVA